MTGNPGEKGPNSRPRQLLRQGNSDLKRFNIWVWTIPALVARLPDGTTVVTCPQAGSCATVCYARFGTYTWSNVAQAHLANLLFVHEDLAGWEQAMRAELSHPKFEGAHVRIHDSGDFYSKTYLEAWLRIIRAFPKTTFYAYTKEVLLIRECVEPDPPANFHVIFSLGGKQDRHVDPYSDRYADVFPTRESIDAAGFHSRDGSDLDAIYGPNPVGMAAKRRPQALRRQGPHTLGELQRARDLRRDRLADGQ